MIVSVVEPPTTWMSYCVLAVVAKEPTVSVALEVARMPPVLTVRALSAPADEKRWPDCPAPLTAMPYAVFNVKLLTVVAAE